MFDPTVWTSHFFQDVEVVPAGQHRQIKMTIPLGFTVALLTCNVVNGDTADQDFQLQWQPNGLTVPSTFIGRTIVVGEARSLIPEMPDAPADPKFQGPFLLTGLGAFIIDSPTNIAGAASVMQYNIHWLQAKFTSKTANAIVPVAVDI